MATVTITLVDNPLAGRPGQTDYTLTISADPDIETGPNGELPPPESLSPATLAAVMAVAEIAKISLEASFVHIAKGSMN